MGKLRAKFQASVSSVETMTVEYPASTRSSKIIADYQAWLVSLQAEREGLVTPLGVDLADA